MVVRVLEGIANGPVYAALLLGVLVVAAWLRWRLDPTPIFDADSMGYTAAAISRCAGGPFDLLAGRSFLYPGWIWIVLELTDSFVGVFYAQTIAGLLSLVVLERTWRRAGRLFAFDRVGEAVYSLVGLLVLVTIGWSATAVHLETSLRPESIFPLFSALSLYFTVRTIEEFHDRPSGPGGIVWPGGLLLVNMSMQVLKPNWGFGAATASLPVLIWLFSPGRSWMNRVAPIAAAIAIFFGAVFVPQQRLSRSDPESTLFVWKTLFLWHAPAIDEEIAADLRSDGDVTNEELLIQIHDLIQGEFAFARDHPDRVGYASLTYNPDRLLYESPLTTLIKEAFKHDVERQVAFYRHYYVRAWLHHTGFMINKVVGQLWWFYGDSDAIYRLYGHVWSRRSRFEDAARALESYLGTDLPPGVTASAGGSPLYRDFWRRCQNNARVSTLVVRAPRPLAWAVKTLRWTYTPTLFACLLLAGGYWLLRNRFRGLLALRFPLLLAIAFYTHNFGHTLTFAVVHAMDIGRYSMTQLTTTVASHALGIVVVLHAMVALWHVRSGRTA